MNNTLSNSAIQLIALYQRYLSPRKGYNCAHRIYFGKSSCSSWAVRIIKKHGVFAFFPLMKKRSQACAMASEKIKEQKMGEPNKEEYSECPLMEKKTAENCLIHSLPCIPCYWA